MLLSLPDIRQEGLHDCGNAAVECVLQFHKIQARARLATLERGTGPDEIEQFFRKLGMLAVSGSMEIEDLKHYCDNWRPVICLGQWPKGDSHWVVVRGVSRRRVYYQCPEDGPEVMSEEQWLETWQTVGRHGPLKQWGICGWLPD